VDRNSHLGYGATVRRVCKLGVSLVVIGGALLGTAIGASAAGKSGTMSFTQTGPVTTTQQIVVVTGSGFTASSVGALFECNTTTGQPTISVPVTVGKTTVTLSGIPVGCSPPTSLKTTSAGKFPATAAFGLAPGVLGPPATGTDSAGNDATKDAKNYPCPPYSNQSSAQCELMFTDAAGDTASQAITFNPTTTPTTTPTTVPTGCTPKANTASAPNDTVSPPTNPSVTVDPATCLYGGKTVTVTTQGFQPNALGSILECNTDGSNGIYAGTPNATLSSLTEVDVKGFLGTPAKTGSVTLQLTGGTYGTFSYTGVTVDTTAGTAKFTGLTLTTGSGSDTVLTNAIVNTGQPYIVYLGNAIPVSCTKVSTFSTQSDGTIAPQFQSFTVQQGTTGPPATGTDSAGNDAATDAANYPCPPTAAQIAAGDGCVIAVGDISGDKVPVPIQFAPNAQPEPTTTTTAVETGASGSEGSGSGSSGSSSGSSGTLAYTGPHPGLWVVGTIGALLLLAGGALLVLADVPRRLAFALRRSARRPSGADDLWVDK